MRQMQELGFAVVAVDYRGFGRSTDVLPSEELVAEDVRAAWDWIGREHPGRARFVFGHSLGGAVAVRLAHEVGDEAGLIVEGGFTSIPDVWASLRWGWIPLEWLITQRFDAGSRIATVGSPVLVVHGSEDGMVQPRLGRALYERAQAPKRFELIDGASHYNANLLGTGQYRSALAGLFGIGAAPCGDGPALASAPDVPAPPVATVRSGPTLGESTPGASSLSAPTPLACRSAGPLARP
jgi:alpha-beta hydrolase superfamily lysophospholipase